MSRRVSIKLTPAQQARIETLVGRTGEALELSVEELEERIAPSRLFREPGASLIDVEPDTSGLLTPHEHVDLGGVGERFDGVYYVDGTTHQIDSGGANTSFDTDRSE